MVVRRTSWSGPYVNNLLLIVVFGCVAQAQVPNNESHLNGKTLHVGTLQAPPFMDVSAGDFQGILFDLFIKIQQIANCNFQFHVQQDGIYGYETDNGEWTGLVGDVMKGTYQIAVAPLTISSSRLKVVDFTQPLMSAGLRILYKKPSPWSVTEAFGVILSPFSFGLWIVILLMLFAISVAFYIIGRFSPYEDTAFVGRAATYEGLTVANSFLYTFSSLTWQGYTAAPRSYSGRVLAGCWWIFTIFVITTFTANLAAFFLTEEPNILSSPFVTFEELSQQTKIKYGTVRKGSTQRFLNSSIRPVAQRIWQTMMSDPSVFTNTVSEGVERVRSSNGDYAFIMEGILAEHLAAKLPCDLVVLGEELTDNSYGAICDKVNHLGLCGELSAHILQLHEEDFVYSVMQKYLVGECTVSNAIHEVFARGVQIIDSFLDKPGVKQEKAVTPQRFGAPLLILGLGLVVSCGLLAVELFIAKRRGHVKQPYHITVPDRERISSPEDAH